MVQIVEIDKYNQIIKGTPTNNSEGEQEITISRRFCTESRKKANNDR